jgi:hypothetical protein
MHKNLTTAVALGIAVGLLVSFLAQAAPVANAPLGSGLSELSASFDRGDPRLPMLLAAHLTDHESNPLVRVRLLASADADVVLQHLSAAGFRLITRSTINPLLVEGYLPLARVHEAAAVPGIRSILAEQRPVRRAGPVPSQAVPLERVNLANSRGLDGAGIRIGALSDSFNSCSPTSTPYSCSTTAAQDIAAGELPAAGVTVLPGQDLPAGQGTDEGRAIEQLLFDIAPRAQLGFATAFLGELQFAENILALRSQFNADVICDDVYYFDEPMYSDGLIAQAVDLVSEAGAAYFSAAGNNGLEAFEDTYRPISFAEAERLVATGHGNVHLEQIPAAIRPLSVHDFRNPDGSPSITQRFTDVGFNQISFQWDEPFNLGLVKTTYILYVFDKDGKWLDPNTAPTVFYTTDDAVETDEAFQYIEMIPFPTDIVGGANVTDYQFVIGKVNDGRAQHIKYVNANGLGVSQRQNAPSTWGHAAATGGRGVAAVYYAIPGFPEDFSSPGPVTIYFDSLGNRLSQPERRFVPQLTAADGVDTSFFGFDSDGDGWPNFFGTSAAAPDAAAVGALVLQAAGGSGSLRPQEVYQRLEKTATSIWAPNVPWLAGTFAGPVGLSINGDWVRWDRDWTLSVGAIGGHFVTSVTLDASPIGLRFNPNPDRFSVGSSNGIVIGDMTWSTSPDATKFTIAFKPGKFVSGSAFDFGLSIYAPIEGSTQEDPDRFRGMRVTVTLDNAKTFNSTVLALPQLPINNFSGFGLVNAEAATRN